MPVQRSGASRPSPRSRPSTAVVVGVVGVAAVVVVGAALVWRATSSSSSEQADEIDTGSVPDDALPEWTLPSESHGEPLTPVVVVAPGSSIQEAVDDHPEGAVIGVGAGVHRMQTVEPKAGNVFLGEPGAVMSGARVLTDWVAGPDGTWYVEGQDQEGMVHGECRDTAPRCSFPEDLFVDDVRLSHVESLEALVPGTWFFDYPADRIYVAEDPAGHDIETSVAPFAFEGSERGVTIRDITVERYANPAQHGAIQSEGPDWLIEGVHAEQNHAVGIIITGDRTVLRNSTMMHNGQMGAGGSDAHDALVEGVEIGYNNEIGFDTDWEGGGFKFTLTERLRVLDSYVHHNDGPGLWFDESAYDTHIEGNTAEANAGPGIYYEISYKALIINNTSVDNGFGQAQGWLWDGGIVVSASSDVEIAGNTVSNNHNGITGVQQFRGEGTRGPFVVQNLYVHDNTIELGSGSVGLVEDMNEPAVFQRNNRFENNTYILGSESTPFAWNGEWTGLDGWHAAGQS